MPGLHQVIWAAIAFRWRGIGWCASFLCTVMAIQALPQVVGHDNCTIGWCHGKAPGLCSLFQVKQRIVAEMPLVYAAALRLRNRRSARGSRFKSAQTAATPHPIRPRGGQCAAPHRLMARRTARRRRGCRVPPPRRNLRLSEATIVAAMPMMMMWRLGKAGTGEARLHGGMSIKYRTGSVYLNISWAFPKWLPALVRPPSGLMAAR